MRWIILLILLSVPMIGVGHSYTPPTHFKELVALIGSESVSTEQKEPDTKVALLCFLTGEQTSGLNKICYYDCLGSGAAITIKAYQLCPLTINR